MRRGGNILCVLNNFTTKVTQIQSLSSVSYGWFDMFHDLCLSVCMRKWPRNLGNGFLSRGKWGMPTYRRRNSCSSFWPWRCICSWNEFPIYRWVNLIWRGLCKQITALVKQVEQFLIFIKSKNKQKQNTKNNLTHLHNLLTKKTIWHIYYSVRTHLFLKLLYILRQLKKNK